MNKKENTPLVKNYLQIIFIYSVDQFITSDSARKENVSLISNAIDKVKQIKGFTYNLKSNTSNKPSALKEEEAVKEQQQLIEVQSQKIVTIEQDCCNKSESLKSALIESTETATGANEAKLYQNTPNPFSEKTEIKCFIPKSSVASKLYVFNMQGIQMVEFPVNETGNQVITLNGNRFKPGMYLYSLVVNGREIDTKRMILTK